MIIGVDAAVLGVFDDRLKVGVYNFAHNLLKVLTHIDKENKYDLYSFSPIPKSILDEFGPNTKNLVLKPQKGWLVFRISLEFLLCKPDIFLGLSQALPFYHPMKSIIYVHDLAFEIYPDFYTDSYQKLSIQTRFAAQNSSKIIAVSKSTKRDLINLYKIKEEKIEVIYHGVENIFKPKTKVNKKENPYFLFVGSYKQGKNIENIIKAFKLFRQETNKSHELILAGSNYWNDLKISKTEGVKIKEFVPERELLELYKNAVGFVFPSFYEGFGMPLLEAMSSGVPVITSNRGSIPEVVGDASLLIAPEDINRLKDAMLTLASDNKLREQLIKKGIIQAQKFSWQKSADQLLNIINNI